MSDPRSQDYLHELTDRRRQALAEGAPLERLLMFSGLSSRSGGLSYFILLLSPVLVHAAWNVLGVGAAFGFGALGWPAVLLLTTFLVLGFWGRVAFSGLLFAVNPGWWEGAAQLHFPQPDAQVFCGLVLMLLVAARDTATP